MKRAPRFLMYAPATLLLTVLATSRTEADYIVVGKTPHSNARLLTLSGGKLQFRADSGKTLAAWISDVSLIVMDKEGAFADFNQAERFVNDGQPQQAVGRYRRAQKLRDDYWSDLIAARLLIAADRAGLLSEAVQNFIRVMRSDHLGIECALRMIPENIPAERNAETVQAIQTLDAALAQDPPPNQRAALELLRYEVFRRSNHPRAAAGARNLCTVVMPGGVDVERPWRILCMALEQSANEDAPATLAEAVDRALREVPESVLPDFLMLKGGILSRSAKSREEIIRAAWPWLRVVIHAPNHPRAPEALYETAGALEKLNLRDKASQFLDECLRHAKASDDIKRKAETALARLK